MKPLPIQEDFANFAKLNKTLVIVLVLL